MVLLFINTNNVLGQFFENSDPLGADGLYRELNSPNDLKCRICKRHPGKCSICEGTKKCWICKGLKINQFHLEKCPNCINWNDSYRNQVPCHRCRNTRQIKVTGCDGCIKAGICFKCKGTGRCIYCKGKGEYSIGKIKQTEKLKLLPSITECDLKILLINGLGNSLEMIKMNSLGNGITSSRYRYDEIENKVYNSIGDLVAIGLEGGDRFYHVNTQRFSFDNFRELEENKNNTKSQIFEVIDDMEHTVSNQTHFNNFPYDWSIYERNFEFIAAINDLNNDWDHIGLFLSNKNKLKQCNVLAKTLVLDKNLVEEFTKPLTPQPEQKIKAKENKISSSVMKNPNTPLESKPCSENIYNWDCGCKNNKIGLMNTILFGDNNEDIYGADLLIKLRNLAYLGPQNTIITFEIYNNVLKLGEEKGTPQKNIEHSAFNYYLCDENIYDWDYGCKNNKIGLMNTILFGDNYGDIYGPALLTKLRNLSYLSLKETKITQDIYNKVVKLGEEKSTLNLK
jgi:hypothetical protein